MAFPIPPIPPCPRFDNRKASGPVVVPAVWPWGPGSAVYVSLFTRRRGGPRWALAVAPPSPARAATTTSARPRTRSSPTLADPRQHQRRAALRLAHAAPSTSRGTPKALFIGVGPVGPVTAYLPGSSYRDPPTLSFLAVQGDHHPYRRTATPPRRPDRPFCVGPGERTSRLELGPQTSPTANYSVRVDGLGRLAVVRPPQRIGLKIPASVRRRTRRDHRSAALVALLGLGS